MTALTKPMPATADLVRSALEGRRRSGADATVSFLLLVALLSSLLILITLLADVIAGAWPTLQARGWEFVTSPLSARPESAGIVQGIMGSLALTGFVVALAFPIGAAAAIYLEEYAPDTRFNRFISTNIRNLAGVPSVVYGILGLALFVKLLGSVTNGRTIVSGGLTLAVLVLPIMIITTAEAIRAVPNDIRLASFGVGATKWETIRHHVLPVAMPAILTGTVLTIARAFGESAPLLLAGALVTNFFAPPAGASAWQLITDERYTALPIIVFNWARQPQKEFEELTAAAIVVLLVLLLTVNAVAIVVRDRYEMEQAE